MRKGSSITGYKNELSTWGIKEISLWINNLNEEENLKLL